MPWFKIDDAFWSHPKTLRLSPEAVALWVRAGTYASQNRTDGVIDAHILPVFGGVSGASQELIDAGLWEPHERGFVFHDWDDYQPSKADIDARREADRARKAEWREKKAAKRGDKSASTDVGKSASTKPSNAQGTRLPEGWNPPTEEIASARQYAPHVDLKAEHERFTDYWLSTPGIKGRKTDWVRTWRNWMKTAESRAKPQTVQGRNRAAEWGSKMVPQLEGIEQ
ncbi:hypothetical protein [Gryllotalpicola koreensis]|uniref:DUF1376 domain-containing protein n=1 Tax=Gryllotalpicola koreensis TaxID=993086 RepID=A0ABP8A1X6_9MICO